TVMLGRGHLRRQLTGLADRVALEHDVAAQHLLDLGVGPVGDQALAVSAADRGRGVRRLELPAADHPVVLPEQLDVAGVDRLPLLVAERHPVRLAAVNQSHVLHVASFRESTPIAADPASPRGRAEAPASRTDRGGGARRRSLAASKSRVPPGSSSSAYCAASRLLLSAVVTNKTNG